MNIVHVHPYYRTITIQLPDIILTKYPIEHRKRSSAIRMELEKFIGLLNSTFDQSYKLFPSRSEFIRTALLFAQSGALETHCENLELKRSSLEEEMESKIIRRLEGDQDNTPKFKKPKQLLILDRYDINKNLVLSFINELPDDQSLLDLEIETGIDSSTIRYSINKIEREYPDLIVHKREGKSLAYLYSVNQEVLNEMNLEVC